MTRKKDTTTVVSQEENAQVQHIFEQFHQIADNLHNSSNQQQAEAALNDINTMSEASQMALLKALSKEHHTNAADILAAINELSPNKSIRKEARRSLIRLEGARIYPGWHPPVAHTPAIRIPVANPPRFWKGYVTQAREEGEIELILCWEHGIDYNEVRMLTFILDFWEQGLKDFILENTNKRNVETQIQQMRTRLPDITITDCTLAEGRRLIEEALAVNKWRGTAPHKDYRHHLPTVNQLILDAVDVGEDRGLTFINPTLEPDEVVGTFVGGWSFGDYGLNYDMLSSDSDLRQGLTRDEWVEQRRAWADEAHPARFELGFIHERESSTPGLWLPSAFGSRSISSRKEVEIGWSLELSDTPLSGTLKEMPMGTVVYKETGRHWFWTSYTLVQEDGRWRIQHMTDEGAKAQGLSIAELQKRIKEHDDRINEAMQSFRPNIPDAQQFREEVVWRIVQTLHYDDALIVQLPLDRTTYGDAYNRAISLGSMERAIAYLDRMAHKFAEHHGAVLRQLGVTQEALGELYRERNMPTRADHFFALAEATLRESLEVEDSTAGHAVLAELLIRRHKDLEEAEIHLNIAKSKGTTTTEEAVIEADLGNIYLERNLLREALQHFQHAADLDPNLEDVWFKIGYIQRNLNQLEDAIVAYERTIEIQPQYIPAYTELCAIYVDQGQLPKARKVLERGLRSNPKSAHLLALLSSVYLESDDLRHARAVLEEAEHINPNLEIVQAMREALNRYRKK